ncbi:helix-turn-helix domain-containing protein [Oleidesulfovibrio alaskensis]|jgi:transcriptional regulator with XRE-family HTH domain|uniref:helix-turn-helix domain-containing protein n=1 Tax=Oleidesulfovibrio alaskensis TaxID=58180 RepID=UPI001A58756A|nr:helix-turn-helix domain-containing protein [Oleidesulfovibrio alaskensis]MBL3580833.1 helix-turn-helix transcriptional regulator [Oleidesulfovibrio alaskensis]MBL3587910.1 helix-turn-helix transcriptional regulator [bacterium]
MNQLVRKTQNKVNKILMSSPHFNHSEFVERLKSEMKRLGITGKDLAEAANLSKQAVSGYLNSERQPSAAVLASWGGCFAIKLDWLLIGKGTPFDEVPTKHAHAKSMVNKPETELGKQLAEIEAALRRVGASDEEIRKAMIAHVGAGKRLEDQDAAQQEPAKASTATS